MRLLNKIIVLLSKIVYPLKVYGKENIPEGGALLCYNHLSAVDPLYVLRIYPKDIRFLAKKELFEHKVLGRILKSFGAIELNRENPEITTLFKVVKVLKGGHKLSISPEGTRNKTGSTDFLQFKSGSALLSVTGKCPIVPVIVEKKAKVFRKNRIKVGKAFELTEFYDIKPTDEDMQKMNDILRVKMYETQQELFELVKRKRRKLNNESI